MRSRNRPNLIMSKEGVSKDSVRIGKRWVKQNHLKQITAQLERDPNLCHKKLIANNSKAITPQSISEEVKLKNSGLSEQSCASSLAENKQDDDHNRLDSITARKSLNDSIVILREVNRKDIIPPSSRKRQHEVSAEIAVMNCDISNDSVISLCSDEEVTIVSGPEIHHIPKKRKVLTKESIPTEDIILLDSSPKNNESSSSLSLAERQKRRRKGNIPCTVTSKSAVKPLDSPLKFFKPPDITAVASIPNGEASSTSFIFDPFGNRQNQQEHVPRKRPEPRKEPVPEAPPGSNVYGSNIYNPNPTSEQKSGGLRPVIIDGSNVAFGHSQGSKVFSSRGLQICVNYFMKRGHRVIAFVPQFRKNSNMVTDKQILEQLEMKGNLVYTPSRRVDGRLVVPYDDRYIVQCAAEMGGVIVSTDNFRDLLHENEAWRETIENRLLMFTWVGDLLMFPTDPLGRHGPKLEEFLRFPV